MPRATDADVEELARLISTAARPEATVLAFRGDGGFVMSSHELDTIGGYHFPVKMIVFDDAALGMVGNQHKLYC
jgi:acetolactate synthase-1/2/3 large subunit